MANSEDMNQVTRALNLMHESILNMDKRAIETDERINTLSELLIQEKQNYSDLENTLIKVKDELKEMEQKYVKLQETYKELSNASRELVDEHDASSLQLKGLAQEYVKLRANIVLTKEQINREGRPKVLTDEEIEWIREQREQGRTLRAIAENLGVSHMTVSRGLKTNDDTTELKKSNVFQRTGGNDGN